MASFSTVSRVSGPSASSTGRRDSSIASRCSTYLSGRPLIGPGVGIAGPHVRAMPVKIVAFKFLKDLGFKKPSFLPDFGLAKRKAILDRFYGKIDRATYEELLAPDFKMQEEGGSKTYTRDDYINQMCNCVAPAIPDFNWTHATDAIIDKDYFAIVTVQATGHHTGKPFEYPGSGLPAVPASGKRFCLAQEVLRVKVEEGKIKEIIVVPSKGAGPKALYEALGGKLPAPAV